ncbi:N-acetylmannosamine-6-phosphate 2-epimerase [Microbacterium pseudoresistens]|uniref:Putative N-acetylmannosamine-6-phosphate 2-epimerase n=1 Tax=Microbacterium pseudoresistens TaxID=640634 RepID=A0A7Y9EUS5_9MICO|nr:N-acetylmannosamine-6-phosphate 2-epimerase [Microbacterium pseudoresistens]NYD53450.1 N-acylglucosamine-6-phosphate 2-epimerase [Microbacterium pseudoresistens]
MIESLHRGLIVSCQAYPGEPLRDARAMALIAQSAARGGAVGIRAQGLADVRAIHEAVDLPQIGLWKVSGDDVFITPTLHHALDVVDAGAEIVAIDGTRRPRPDGLTLAETIARIHERTGALVMADAGSLDDARAAEDAGADIVGTTLAGYTDEREKTDGPDLELLAACVEALTTPVFAEGRIRTPAQARKALDAGAYAVVVGTAITHPTSITSWFAQELADA